MKFTIVLLLLSSLSFAIKAPKNFSRKGKNYKFVDFERISYEIEYDVKSKTVTARTEIYFKQKRPGRPIFDLIPSIESIEVNGQYVTPLTVTSPNKETTYRSIEKELLSGSHKMVITNKITKNVRFESDTISSAFWMSDLQDRQYIEQYLPTNIEYDQFQIDLKLNILNTTKQHLLYTNGKAVEINKGTTFTVEYPNYFTASSLYFHLTPTGKFQSTSFKFKSKSNKNIPVVIYNKKSFFGTSLKSLKKTTISILNELESKFGNWPHESLTIYNAGQGGMEYSGATITSTNALGHELTHSYFARGVMPVDGNSGWLDEAIASWRDNGYKATSKPNFTKTQMAAHSQYRRRTDRNAYTKGANFMAFLNHRLKDLGGLRLFLNELHTNFTHTNITTKDFIKELNKFSGEDFQKEFDQYIFSRKSSTRESALRTLENPNHPQLSEKEQLELL